MSVQEIIYWFWGGAEGAVAAGVLGLGVVALLLAWALFCQS